jgi:proteasome lid subunit RPN8/RPN11
MKEAPLMSALTAPASGWTTREAPRPDGTIVKWRERAKPGEPGVIERHYIIPDDRFGPPVGTAGFSYSSEQQRHSEPWRRLLRFTKGDPVEQNPSARVAITSWAKEQILDCNLSSSVEQGGPLFGIRDADDGVFVIESAYRMGKNNERLRMSFDIDLIDEFESRSLANEIVGTWHSHPYERRQGPGFSEADLNTWRSWARNKSKPLAHIIVGPSWAAESQGLNGWVLPDWAAWVVPAIGDVSDAKLEFEGGW